MKIFKKLLILKWHYIEHICVDLGSVNFLTGKNGSGKSTIIDAMQVVLLGSTNGAFFNKAANDRSQRTLLSYAKGELSDDEDAGYKYLRNDDFTSLIALEVYDDLKKKSFTIGIQIDVASDNSSTNRFFILDAIIPGNHFVHNGLVMNISELKAFAIKEKFKLEQFTSNRKYQETLRGRLGNINKKYFSLFRKAVPFSPITDIKGFITEFICDTEKKVNIEDMRNNIRYYENMRLEAEDVEKRVFALEKISVAYTELQRLTDLIYLQGYIVDEAKKRQSDEEVKRIEEAIEAGRVNLENLKQNLATTTSSHIALEKEVDSIKDALIASDVYKQEKTIKQEIEKLDEKIKRITEDKERVLYNIRHVAENWHYIASETAVENHQNNMTVILDEVSKIIEFILSEDLKAISTETLSNIDELMEADHQVYDLMKYELSSKINTMIEEKSRIRDDIVELERGKKVIPKEVAALRQLLIEELSHVHGYEIDVHMICDRIEVSDPRWHNAVEGYLHLQKFNLYVEPIYFQEALNIYDKYKHSRQLYDVGLVDMEKIISRINDVLPSSLAEVVSSEDEYATAYMNFLLGKVIRVEKLEELRNFPIAITPSCMLYKSYVARQLHPRRYEVPFIGKMAVLHQLEQKRIKLKALEDELVVNREVEGQLGRLSSLKPFGEYSVSDFSRNKGSILQLPSMKKQREVWERKLSDLDKSNIIELTFKLEEVEKAVRLKSDEITTYKASIMSGETTINTLKYEQLPSSVGRQKEKSRVIEETYDLNWIMTIGLRRFENELERLKYLNKVVDNFNNSRNAHVTLKDSQKEVLISFRSDYIREFQGTFDIQSSTNREFDELLLRLKETDLPAYKDKIDEAIKMAQREFRDDFLSKLKFNIDTVKEQIEELNAALKHMSFGQDDYMFKVTPNGYYRQYYDMIMDPNLLDGFNMFSFDFQEKYKDVIDELFKKIVDVGEGAISADERAEIERNITKYTDYRTYLDFDLVVTDGRGNKSHLSKMISKKSGGETQTPFYISVLASFFRVYRMNHKSKDTSRLVIFDEAFSKMDHERIEVCIRLLTELGFQALISAPSEKIANITPLVDKTLCVIKSGSGTVVRPFTKEELLT